MRRVIELALPEVLAATGAGAEARVTLACGEAADEEWNAAFRRRLAPRPVEFLIEPSFRYYGEQRIPPDRIAAGVTAALERLLAGADPRRTLVWAHNLGLARNLLLTAAVGRVCSERKVRLVAHHHDWWFDHRWQRWPEVRASGFRSLAAAARAVFPASDVVRHVGINQADAGLLERHFPGHPAWMPNPMEPLPRPGASAVRRVQRWLCGMLGDEAPVWLVPCRLLRRKNLAEALLLTRWLRPEGWLATTGGTSSAEEQTYHARLQSAASRNGWRLRLGLLAGAPAGSPGVPGLLAASEAVLLTSIQEGFGLPYLEAVATGRPLIARHLPNVAPDLRRFGFGLPQSYEDLLVDVGLLDIEAERRRQQRLFAAWKRRLPAACRGWVETPRLLEDDGGGGAVAFSRLTLTAQLEVLEQPLEESFRRCAALNPFLERWRRDAAGGRLETRPWPRRAGAWLGAAAYRQRWTRLLRNRRRAASGPEAGRAIQEDFMRARLTRPYLYPLLWAFDS